MQASLEVSGVARPPNGFDKLLNLNIVISANSDCIKENAVKLLQNFPAAIPK